MTPICNKIDYPISYLKASKKKKKKKTVLATKLNIFKTINFEFFFKLIVRRIEYV